MMTAIRRVYGLSSAGILMKDTDRLTVTSFDDAAVGGQDITSDRPRRHCSVRVHHRDVVLQLLAMRQDSDPPVREFRPSCGPERG
jgi:hypothetical protein